MTGTQKVKTYKQVYNEQKKSAALGCPQGMLSGNDASVVMNYINNNPNDPDVVRYNSGKDFEKLPEVLKKYRAMEEIRKMGTMDPDTDSEMYTQIRENMNNPAFIYALDIYANTPGADGDYRDNYRRAHNIMEDFIELQETPSKKAIKESFNDEIHSMDQDGAIASSDNSHKTEPRNERIKNVTEDSMKKLDFSTGINFEGFADALENAKRKTLGITRADSPEMKRVKDALKKVVEISKGGKTNLLDARKVCSELLEAADSYVNNPSKAKNDRYELVSRIKELVSSDIKTINGKETTLKEKINAKISDEIKAKKINELKKKGEAEKEKEIANKTEEKAEVDLKAEVKETKEEPVNKTEEIFKTETKVENDDVKIDFDSFKKGISNNKPNLSDSFDPSLDDDFKDFSFVEDDDEFISDLLKDNINEKAELLSKHKSDGLTERGAENIVNLHKLSEEAKVRLVEQCDRGEPVQGGDDLKDIFSYEITQKMLSVGNKDGSYNKMFSLLNSNDFLNKYREEFSGPSFNQQCSAVFKPEILKKALTLDKAMLSRLTSQASLQTAMKMRSAPAVANTAQPKVKETEITHEKEGVSNGPNFG